MPKLAETHVHSIPIDVDGTPKDKSLRPITFARMAKAPDGPALRSVPSSDFDPSHIEAGREQLAADAAKLPDVVRQALDHVPTQKAEATPGPVHAPEAPRAKYIGGRTLTETMPLEFPLEFDGVEYHSLTLSVVTGKSFEGFSEMTAKGHSTQDALLAVVTGAPVGLMAELYLDDRVELWEQAQDFLPRRIRRVMEAELRQAEAEQASPNGPNTSPS